MTLPDRLRELASRMHPQAEGKVLLVEAANEIDRLRAYVVGLEDGLLAANVDASR